MNQEDRLLKDKEQDKIANDFFNEISTNELRINRGHYEIIIPDFIKAQDTKSYAQGVKDERERIMKIFASFGKIQLAKPLSGKEFEALFNG